MGYMTPEFEQKLFPLLAEHEGRVRWMYPDTKGNVTVGVGHLLASPVEAAKLPFLVAGRRATYQEILGGWLFVRRTHQAYTPLTLADASIDLLLRKDVERFEPIVQKTFDIPLPETALLAIWDMVFNLGSFGKFPKFVAAVRAGDWETAAAESKRRDIGVGRNKDTADALLALVADRPPEITA